MNRRLAAIALLAALLTPAAPAPARAQDAAVEYRGAAALGLQLRTLGTTKRVLMVGAHPDDEDTQLLARFALEEGADVAYLSLTRGEGGQNGIGPELGEGLGLLRTEELLAARRVDGAAQFFTRAYDFGFSKSAEEAYGHWPREELLRDVVLVIRQYRPDLIVTVFSGTPRDGHGQHQVSALLAQEAFAAAADPARFPDQIGERGLRPWQASKLYMSMRGNPENATVRLAVGNLDPLIGRSPFQLAMASRSRHRSQDMGRPELPGPRLGTVRRILPALEGTEPSVWAGIDTTLALEGPPESFTARALARYQQQVQAARAAYNPLNPGAIADDLAQAVATLRTAMDSLPRTNGVADLNFQMFQELRQAEAAAVLAAGVVVDGVADDARVAPGQAFEVEVTLWNSGAQPLSGAGVGLEVPRGWGYEPVGPEPADAVAAGAVLTRRFRVQVPADADPTQPYFLRAARQGDLYRWPQDEQQVGAPFQDPPIRACARMELAPATPIVSCTEATFREVDLRQGELRRPVMVVPAVSVLLDPRTRVLSTAAPRPIDYTVRLASEAPQGIAGTVRLELPAGWRAEPASVPVRFTRPGEVREVRFSVTAPASTAPGDHPLSAVFVGEDGTRFDRGVQMIDYPHVRPRPLYHDTRSVIRAFDVRVPQGLRVAYIEGAGEEGPGFLANLGITPDLLDADDLAEGDLDQYDVIVAGSRVYEVRQDVMAHNQRLLDYVSRGGTLIVQYNKYEIVEGRFTPYPITMARPHGRVTDENAPVRILDPAHPVFTTPNRITEQDWRGWVQERGLYFADTWDPAYTPLLETGDPGEKALQGGLLIARHGEGTYVYTGLAFFRQFPEGVPGAYRLFANLLALGAN